MVKSSPYRSSPDDSLKGWPPGVPYIVGNEACERFSFYGMKAILWPYLSLLFCERAVSTGTLQDPPCTALSTDGIDPEVLDAAGQAAVQALRAEATGTYHLFVAAVYALPMLGAVLADRWLGRYRTILWLSLVYCAGHGLLALSEGDLHGSLLALGLIAIGSGGIKPCVTAHVGDQFGRSNQHRLERVYNIFYFAINFGSLFSTMLTPLLRVWFGWSVAFGVPGILMAVATLFFWLGRHRFVHRPAIPGGALGALDALGGAFLLFTIVIPVVGAGLGAPWAGLLGAAAISFCLGVVLTVWRQRIAPSPNFVTVVFHSLRARTLGPTEDAVEEQAVMRSVPPWMLGGVRRFGLAEVRGPAALLRITPVLASVSLFWALFDQQGSSWIQQASQMERTLGPFEILKEQMQVANPVLVLLLVPITQGWLYPSLRRRGMEPTMLRRMRWGMYVTVLAFASSAVIQELLARGETLHILWQLVPYTLLTLAEVMVSITGLEFAYREAPQHMKSAVMALFLLTMSTGDLLTAAVALLTNLSPTQFLWLFTALMLVAAWVFERVSLRYEAAQVQ